MSVTLNTRSIVLLVALTGVLVGFAVSQIAFGQAEPRAAAGNGAHTSALPATYYLRQMDRSLDNIEDATEETCKVASEYDYLCN